MRTAATDLVGIDVPIFAFSHCRDVVAAVTNAGGLGVLGAVAHTPEQLDIDLTWIEGEVKGRPYGVDLLVPEKFAGSESGGLDRAALGELLPAGHRQWLDGLLDRYGIPPLPAGTATGGRSSGIGGMRVDPKSMAPLLDVLFAHETKLVASALGPPPPHFIERAHGAGIPVAALAGSVEHAVRHKAAGADLVVAQGTEAGGHTGQIATMVLVPEVVDAVGPAAGPRRRGHRPRPAARRRHGPGCRRRVVRLGVADHRGGRDQPRGQGEVPPRRAGRHGPLPVDDRQAGADAAQPVDRGVGVRRGPRDPADAAAADARRRGAGPDQPRGRHPGHRRRTTWPPTSSARSSAARA